MAKREHRINASFNEDVFNKIQEAAEENDTTPTAYVYKALMDKLRKDGKL